MLNKLCMAWVPIAFLCFSHSLSAAEGDVSADSVPDPASVALPDLQFSETPQDIADYDKYYYFHRTDTSFETALTDLRECDGFASGLSGGGTYQTVPYPYAGTMAGAVGGLVGNALASAIYGSAEKRRVRRVNMRRCMGYKGYARFGLQKDLWEKFNFEEGLSKKPVETRQMMLAQQAKVASGERPTAKELGL